MSDFFDKLTDCEHGCSSVLFSGLLARSRTSYGYAHAPSISLTWYHNADFFDQEFTPTNLTQPVSQRRRYLSLDEIDRLLKNSHPRLYPVVVCALMTGMRRGEIRNLSWENIDWERGIIHIRKAKSGRAREVPITSRLREVLAGLPGERVGSAFKLPDIMLTRFFARAVRDAAITDFVFHDLRHTFASHFLMRTHNLPALQSLLGHSTPLLTLRYAHLSRPHIQEGMALFEAGMAQPRIMPPAPTPGIYQVEHVQ